MGQGAQVYSHLTLQQCKGGPIPYFHLALRLRQVRGLEGGGTGRGAARCQQTQVPHLRASAPGPPPFVGGPVRLCAPRNTSRDEEGLGLSVAQCTVHSKPCSSSSRHARARATGVSQPGTSVSAKLRSQEQTTMSSRRLRVGWG
jgi:hypothetical protein